MDGSLTHFDAVIANPPFSLKNWGHSGWGDDPFGRAEFGVPPVGYADLAFVEHMLASMSKARGRLAVVLPHGALFRGGVERNIRRGVLAAGLVEAVIGLAPNLFYNTGLAAAVLVCRAEVADGRRGSVLFIDASGRFKKGRNQNELTPDDIRALVDTYHGAPTEHAGVHARLVPVEELAENDWDMNIGRYVVVEAEAELELSAAVARYAASRDALRAVEQRLEAMLAEHGFSV
jgi:type I restriction enzyme M protein